MLYNIFFVAEIDEYYADVKYERIAILNALAAYYTYLGKIETKQRDKEEHFISATQYYNRASRIDAHEPYTWIGKGLGSFLWFYLLEFAMRFVPRDCNPELDVPCCARKWLFRCLGSRLVWVFVSVCFYGCWQLYDISMTLCCDKQHTWCSGALVTSFFLRKTCLIDIKYECNERASCNRYYYAKFSGYYEVSLVVYWNIITWFPSEKMHITEIIFKHRKYLLAVLDLSYRSALCSERWTSDSIWIV